MQISVIAEDSSLRATIDRCHPTIDPLPPEAFSTRPKIWIGLRLRFRSETVDAQMRVEVRRALLTASPQVDAAASVSVNEALENCYCLLRISLVLITSPHAFGLLTTTLRLFSVRWSNPSASAAKWASRRWRELRAVTTKVSCAKGRWQQQRHD